MNLDNVVRSFKIQSRMFVMLHLRIAYTIAFSLFVSLSGFAQTITIVSEEGNVLYPMGKLSLTFVGDSYDRFQWFKDGTPISSGTNPWYTVSEPGTYVVEASKSGKKTRSGPFIATYSALNGNHILINTLQLPVVSESAVENLSFLQSQREIQYFDGMSRLIQTIQIQGTSSSTPRDVVSNVEYDGFGRLAVKYLPFVSSVGNGTYQKFGLGGGLSYANSDHFRFYNSTDQEIAHDSKPYALSIFEPSPLGKVTEQGSPGAVWQPGSGASLRISEETNVASEVIRFQFEPVSGDLTWLDAESKPKYYNANQLYRIRTTNEHGFDQITYTDKSERVLLKRNESLDGFLDTYYIYDLAGNLMYVLTPEATKRLQMLIR